MASYRGAVVEDLQLSPALVLPSTTLVGDALQMAWEREFTILPISDPATRNLSGWLNADVLKRQVSSSKVSSDAPLDSLLASAKEGSEVSEGGSVSRFTKTKRYQVITPDTPLEELEQFFKTSGSEFALITDAGRKFVLGIVTAEDLDKFVARRDPKAKPQAGPNA